MQKECIARDGWSAASCPLVSFGVSQLVIDAWAWGDFVPKETIIEVARQGTHRAHRTVSPLTGTGPPPHCWVIFYHGVQHHFYEWSSFVQMCLHIQYLFVGVPYWYCLQAWLFPEENWWAPTESASEHDKDWIYWFPTTSFLFNRWSWYFITWWIAHKLEQERCCLTP